MKEIKTCWLALASSVSVAVAILITFTGLADPPPPVLTIQSLGSNQYSITITNGVTNEVYSLSWTPTLSDPDNYPFTLLSIGDLGQTNWTVDGTDWPFSFFRANIGINWSSITNLAVTIDLPLNGSQLQ